MMGKRFYDRREAGKLLAARLAAYGNRSDILVLALPRGGIPVGFEVASALHVPLDVLVARKLGVPGEEELAMGALAGGGVHVVNEDVVRLLHISDEVIDAATTREQAELERREHLYRGERPIYHVYGRTVILIDDGIATGATMRAAIAVVKQQQSAQIVVAVPMVAPSTCDELAREVEEVVSVIKPEPFYGVGYWYEHFPQLSDETVRSILEQAWSEPLPEPHNKFVTLT
jgi:putative phosphoribosyl transferase